MTSKLISLTLGLPHFKLQNPSIPSGQIGGKTGTPTLLNVPLQAQPLVPMGFGGMMGKFGGSGFLNMSAKKSPTSSSAAHTPLDSGGTLDGFGLHFAAN